MTYKENFMNWDNLGKALITGSSSGIGAEFARQLAEQGFDLILVARRKEKLNQLASLLIEKNDNKVEFLIADLSQMSDIEKVVSRIKKLDNLDVLINNAGFGFMSPFLQIEQIKLVNMINVHFTSPVLFCHAALPKMIESEELL